MTVMVGTIVGMIEGGMIEVAAEAAVDDIIIGILAAAAELRIGEEVEGGDEAAFSNVVDEEEGIIVEEEEVVEENEEEAGMMMKRTSDLEIPIGFMMENPA